MPHTATRMRSFAPRIRRVEEPTANVANPAAAADFRKSRRVERMGVSGTVISIGEPGGVSPRIEVQAAPAYQEPLMDGTGAMLCGCVAGVGAKRSPQPSASSRTLG